MNCLYKLVTTKNVEINYDAFKKKELIECLATMRDIYFSLKQENKQLKDNIRQMNNSVDKLQKQLIKEKDNWNELKEFIVKEYYMYLPLEASAKPITILTDKMQELERSDSNE